MSHFRRMEPQPPADALFYGDSEVFMSAFGPNALGEFAPYLTARRCDIYRDPRQALRVPSDMARARPWQDRDGEWYWRRELHEEKV